MIAIVVFGLAIPINAEAAISYVQGTSANSNSSGVLTKAYASAQVAGDLNVVIVSWIDGVSTVSSVTDSKGNTYVAAFARTVDPGTASEQIFYAKNISSATAGSNTVTVTYNTTVPYPEIRIMEYSGVDTVNPFDVGVGGYGTGATQNSGSLTTTSPNEVLVASNDLSGGSTAAGTGYTQRFVTPVNELVEDKIVTTTGTYSATSTQSGTGWWVMQVAAFRAASTGDTTPPSAPTGLTATATSSTQINLSWTASTDNVAVTGYHIERCSGASCTTFAEIGTSTTTSYSATGLTASTAYSLRIRATDAAGNLSTYSSTASATTSAPDTTPPGAPSGLTAAVISSSQINLSWAASTDNVGVSGYRVEDCSGASCTTFAQIGTPTTTSYSATGLTASTSYTFRVRANDAAGNLSSYSPIASASTTVGSSAYVQGTYNYASSSATLSKAYAAAQTAGDLNVVIIGWNNGTSTVSSVTDSKGNTYVAAFAPTVDPGTASQQIYYAKNISSATAGSNTVTVTYSGTVPNPEIRILEYTGLDPVNPFDVGVGAYGTGATQNSGSVTTSSANEVLVASNNLSGGSTAAGTGYTQRFVTFVNELVEDKIVTTTGSYNATSTQSGTSWWIIQMAAFRAASGSGDTTPPSAPTGLTATVASSSQINLSWTASTDNVGVTGYLVESCSGASCTTFAQIGTPTTTTYSATGLTASTSYNFRVRATDAAGNLSTYSSTASGTTSAASDTTPPSAPSGLTASVISSSQINLSWTASTDNVGVTGYRVESCSGASCTTFAQIGTPTTTTYSATGLTASTSYSFRVRATDAAGNLGSYSNTARGTTQAVVDTTPPSSPTGLSASVASSSQINLSWTASTDNVGVTGYRVERCQGASCTAFAQIGTPATTSYGDIGLTASTSYGYRVRATDAAGNLSSYSNTASGTTQAASTTPPTIASPVDGTAVMPGQVLSIIVNAPSGSFPGGVAVFGHDPLGDTNVQIPAGSPLTFTLSIPASLPLGSYSLTAAGVDATGTLISSAPIMIVIDRADLPTTIVVDPSSVTLRSAGDTRALTVIGAFSSGEQMEVTGSSHLITSSEDTTIATIQNGTITAVGSGQTNVDLQMGGITSKVSVTVP